MFPESAPRVLNVPDTNIADAVLMLPVESVSVYMFGTRTRSDCSIAVDTEFVSVEDVLTEFWTAIDERTRLGFTTNTTGNAIPFMLLVYATILLAVAA